jgi:uncharacterized protein
MPETAKHWYIADPVHQFVEFGPHQATVKALVGSSSFQRLRRISQLGLASYVFPGAVHTRFSHCLGAAHLAAQLVAQLGGQLAVDRGDARTVVCAALLHDVGHGPFSHSFERALKRVLPSAPRHEQWTRTIVLQQLASTLKEFDVSPERVCALVAPSPSDPEVPTFLRQIISSQIDVDRMDYLCRDAHFSGVSVGRIDLQYLIRNICVVQHGTEQTLGLTSKGVACYEAFAFARHVMNRSVYFHKQVATFECMMEECIRLLVESDPLPYEPELIPALRRARAAAQGDLAATLFEPYHAVTEDQLWTAIEGATKCSNRLGWLSRMLVQRTAVPSFLVIDHKHAVLEQELRRAGFSKDHYAVRTLPSSLYKQESGEQVFLADDGNAGAVHISKKSSLVEAFRDRSDTESVLVVFDQGALQGIKDAAQRAHCLDADAPKTLRPPAKVKSEPPAATKTIASGG